MVFEVRLEKDLSVSLRRGHPWVYAGALARLSKKPPAGALVTVLDRGGAPLAKGFYDPEGAIAVRVLTRDVTQVVDGAWVAERVASACALRRAASGCLDGDAVRLVHGESDFLPGLVVDLYADTGVARFDGAAAEAAWAPWGEVVAGAIRGAGFPLSRLWARPAEGRAGGGRVWWGDEPPALVFVREGRARFEVDVKHGQKTGLFLDQRPGRARVGELAAGQRVLNLFSYTGGFSVMAALGEARQVTTVDLAKPAIAAAERNFKHSGVAVEGHEFVAADCRDFLREAAAKGRTWDLAVCDPPSFAPSEKAKTAGLAAYRGLNAQVARVVAPGGLLASASCSSHVSEGDFAQVVADGCAEAGRTAKVVWRAGAGVDHPVSPAFPEGRYLKFLLLRLE